MGGSIETLLMRRRPSLDLELYRAQRSLLSERPDGRAHFDARYLARYRRAFRSMEGPLSGRALAARISRAEVVYVGAHPVPEIALAGLLALVRSLRTRARRGRLVVALDVVRGRHQRELDDAVLRPARSGHLLPGSLRALTPLRPLLDLARRSGTSLLAIGSGAVDPLGRDRYAAARIAARLDSSDTQLIVLTAAPHAAPRHLPARVSAAARRPVHYEVIYQSTDELTTLQKSSGPVSVSLRPGELCVLPAPPLELQQRALDERELAGDDAPLAPGELGPTLKRMSGLIARVVGVDVDTALKSLAVLSVVELRELLRRCEQAGLDQSALEGLRSQVLTRESFYVPQARVAYVARRSVNHAAEEAAHFVRHCAAGERMSARRRGPDAFYARTIEEALAFFGSKLINPRRQAPTLARWERIFRDEAPPLRQIAAFVLAHKGAERRAPRRVHELIPSHDGELFNAVSHSLGYLLGDALFQAYRARRLSRRQLRAMFHDPLRRPAQHYLRWVARVG